MLGRRRVVITGIGMVSPLGNDAETTWTRLLTGKSGIVPISEFDTTQFSTRFAGTIRNLNLPSFLDTKESRKMDPFIQYGVIAGIQAMQDSGLEITENNQSRVGVSVGSGIGGIGTIEENYRIFLQAGPRKIPPFFVPATILNMISGHLSIRFRLKGPSLCITTACASGIHNIGYASRLIAYGDVDAMLAGGSEKASTPLGIAGFSAARALSKRNDAPEQASRPWDKGRDGFVLSDGAGVVMLEAYEHACARGARMYAELVGIGMTSDAHHITLPAPGGSGALQAMQAALQDGRVEAGAVDYINAHGTSTSAGDIAETQAMRQLFDATERKNLLVSSTKSMTGHLLGAAGAVETIFTVQALRDQAAPPTINLDELDPECAGFDFVPHEARQAHIEYALCNGFGFGGTNGSLLLKRI